MVPEMKIRKIKMKKPGQQYLPLSSINKDLHKSPPNKNLPPIDMNYLITENSRERARHEALVRQQVTDTRQYGRTAQNSDTDNFSPIFMSPLQLSPVRDRISNSPQSQV